MRPYGFRFRQREKAPRGAPPLRGDSARHKKCRGGFHIRPCPLAVRPVSYTHLLAEFPHKFEVVSDKLLALWGIRFTIVMNYLAFYTVDDATQTVHIVRFLYGKSNWITILKTDAVNGSLPMFS